MVKKTKSYASHEGELLLAAGQFWPKWQRHIAGQRGSEAGQGAAIKAAPLTVGHKTF